jgi:hypothetical protein
VLGLAEACAEGPLGAEPLSELLLDVRFSETEFTRVFLCLPPYSASGMRIEVRSQLLTASAVISESAGVSRSRAVGWMLLSDQITRKQLGRWLTRAVAVAGLPPITEAFREVVPERDILQLMGRGRSGQNKHGVTISDVVLELFGRDNALLATRRVIVATGPDAALVQEAMKTLPPGFQPSTSLFALAQSFLVPSANKY